MGGLRASLLKGLGASLFILAGCGGRTSALDPEAVYVEPSQPSGTAGAGNSGSKPSPSAGSAGAINTPPIGKGGTPAGNPGAAAGSTGGSTSTPSNNPNMPPPTGASTGAIGEGGASALDPWVIAKCNDFCNSDTQAPCPTSPSSADCTDTCQRELLATGSQVCQKYGGAVLECMTTVYKNSSNCNDVDRLSTAKCSSQFESYQSCAVDAPPGTSTCSTSSIVSDTTCYLDLECGSRGHFSVYCSEGARPDQSNCNCYGRFLDGSGFTSNVGLSDSVSFACVDVLGLCGIPQAGLK